VFLAGARMAGQAADPFVGTWKLNVAKSKYTPGPAPKSQTVKIEPAGEGRNRVTNDGVTATGQTTHVEYVAASDGKDYPIQGSDVIDTVSLKQIDSRTADRTDKKGGKIVQTLHAQVSADGRTLTVTVKGTNAEGQAVNATAVYEK
jgi:hypothetical protein